MIEIIGLRQENAKTFWVDSKKKQLQVSIGAIHYKDDYASDEQWKDIDLTWELNRITKAPYELTLDGQKLTIRDKRSGEVSTIELLDAKPPGMKWEIVPENTRVSFRHILPSDKIPFEAKFKVTGKGLIATKAFDDDGELPLEVTLKDGLLTERLTVSSLVRPVKGMVRIDPTWQVEAGTDDCAYRLSDGYWSTTYRFRAGYYDSSYNKWGSAARFLNITIPAGTTITLANLVLTCYASNSGTIVKTRLRAQANINPATFSTAADFDARTWTTAYVYWDAIPAWVLDTEYTSPDIKACIQEVIGLSGWASGNPMAICWDDFQNRATAYRDAYSYDLSTTQAPKLVITYAVPSTYELSASDGLKLSEVLATQCAFGLSVTDGLKGGDLSGGVGIFPKSASDGLTLGDLLALVVFYYTMPKTGRYGVAPTTTTGTSIGKGGRYGG